MNVARRQRLSGCADVRSMTVSQIVLMDVRHIESTELRGDVRSRKQAGSRHLVM